MTYMYWVAKVEWNITNRHIFLYVYNKNVWYPSSWKQNITL